MKTASKIAAKDSCNYALNKGNSNETNIKVTQEIAALFGNVPKPNESYDVSFYIEKGDFIRSLCQIMGTLPLYDNKGRWVPFSEQLFNEKTKAIYDFFGEENSKEIKAKLTKPGTHPICLNFGSNSFCIRDFLVESRSILTFTESNGKIKLKIEYDDRSSITLENRDSKIVAYQQIFYGTPGSGKSWKIKQLYEMSLVNGKWVEDNKKKKYVIRTTFHPDTDYSQFVGCYKPKTYGDGEEKKITYTFVPQPFTEAYVKAWSDMENKYYLIIEEINRGNCAQIFGDLFQLLDRNKKGYSEYPIKADHDLEEYLLEHLPEGNGGIEEGKLCLPPNLSIIASMNTSDQSLFPMDSAFKRRWEWEYVPICYDKTTQDGNENKAYEFTITINNNREYSWINFLRVVNYLVKKVTDSEDKQMGNFFIKHNVEEKEFISKVMYYLWSEVCKDNFGSGQNFFRKDDDKEFSFNELFDDKDHQLLVAFMDYLQSKTKEKDELKDIKIEKEKKKNNSASHTTETSEEVKEEG